MYFQWESVQHASEYELQVGTQLNFTDGTYESCRVAGTTYVPGQFAINTTGSALDQPRQRGLRAAGGPDQLLAGAAARPTVPKSGDIPGVQGIFSETQGFTLPAAELQQPVAGQAARTSPSRPCPGPR